MTVLVYKYKNEEGSVLLGRKQKNRQESPRLFCYNIEFRGGKGVKSWSFEPFFPSFAYHFRVFLINQVTYGNTSTVEKLSTSFSKASFVAKDQGEEVDLDDPDFWKKAIGLVEQAAPEEEEEVRFWRR